MLGPKPGRSGGSDPNSDIAQQINKRLTLNLLIQGAAAHSYTTASHLARAELEAIRPGLNELYDGVAISCQLNYCIGDNALVFGRPNRFWGLLPWPQKIFRNHPLMSKYGNKLATQATKHLRKQAKAKGFPTARFLHWCGFIKLITQVSQIEKGLGYQLSQIAVKVVSEMWQIPAERLDGRITRAVTFGNLQKPNTIMGRLCRTGVIGYGGVERSEGRFNVKARAWFFPLLIHELVKGTVELICLHGLNHLEESVYQAVIGEADQLDYEAWLLQAGPEMWRKFIAAAPRNVPLAKTIMRIAKLDPIPLDKLMIQIIEDPNRATDVMTKLKVGLN